MAGDKIRLFLAIVLLLCIIASAIVPIFGENSGNNIMAIVGTLLAAIIAVVGGIQLYSLHFTNAIMAKELGGAIGALLCAGGILTLIPHSAIWHDSKNAKATWVMVMNGFGTAFYGAAASSLLIPVFQGAPANQ